MFNRNKDLFFIKVLNKLLGNNFNLTKEDTEIYSVCSSNDLSIVILTGNEYNTHNLLSNHAQNLIGSVYILIKQGNEYKLINNNIEPEGMFRKYERVYDISISSNNKAILITYSQDNIKCIDILKFSININNPEDTVESLPFIEHEYTIQLEDTNCFIESAMFTNNEHFGFKVMCTKTLDDRFILYYKYNIKTDEYILSRKSNLIPNEYLTDSCSILFY